MKISTLAAAVFVGGLIGFAAPNAQAFPQGKQQINAEQTATVTEVGFRNYKKRHRKYQPDADIAMTTVARMVLTTGTTVTAFTAIIAPRTMAANIIGAKFAKEVSQSTSDQTINGKPTKEVRD